MFFLSYHIEKNVKQLKAFVCILLSKILQFIDIFCSTDLIDFTKEFYFMIKILLHNI